MLGLSGAGGPGGYQFLDLGAAPTFETPIGAIDGRDAAACQLSAESHPPVII
jgi:hypothetical protein